MKRFFPIALAMVTVGTAFGATINLNTGVAARQVYSPLTGSVISAVAVSPNGAWAPAPLGSSWVSISSVQNGYSPVAG